MRIFTRMHLDAARAMPRKSPPLWFSEKAGRHYRRRAKRERKLIARWYLAARADPEVDSVRMCHRYQVVVTAAEAKLRLKHYDQ